MDSPWEGGPIQEGFDKMAWSDPETIPRWKKSPYYGILKNSYLLKECYDGSFDVFLRRAADPLALDGLQWRDLGAVQDDTWRALAPWKQLFGVGENIFLYILRDIDFAGSRAKDAFKLDSRNMSFFDGNNLWELAGASESKSNEDAVKIIRVIIDRIKAEDPEWDYSIADVNAAIYIAGKKSTA